MAELLIGTSGYDYPVWQGIFYPEELPRENFLQYYSEQFNSLELNYTYYTMPTSKQMYNMKKRSNGKVKFSVKAFQELTHKLNTNTYQKLAAEFISALEPLLVDNLLLCALIQFPQKFHYEPDERKYLDLLLSELKEIPLVVEMRNIKWQNDQVYNALRQRKIGWCITDNPPLKDLPKLEFITTNDIAYIRFHGRNAKMWYKGDNITRYDYLYTDEELKTFINPIKELLQNAKIVQLFFNNHAKSSSTVNAKKIEILLQ
jgi:uncharacterized protein YecE (DUF72 family)